MYKSAVRWMIRRNIASLNAGDYRPVLAMLSDDIELSFPGDNSWADEFRPVQRGREAHVTHRGKAEVEPFLQHYVEAGLQMHIEDILVNGPPWNLRAAVRVVDWSPGDDGDRYNNRAVLFVRSRWGKIVSQEDYEDTERAAAFDAVLAKGDAIAQPAGGGT